VAPNGNPRVIFVEINTPSDLVELGGLEPPWPLLAKEQEGCSMPWLTWHYSLCKIAYSGGKSDVVVVRTVVSV
jgi:hypothetical protein